MRYYKKQKNKWAGETIQLVDAENYSNINLFPGSNHKHCDEAKAESPAGFETLWNSFTQVIMGLPPGNLGLLCVVFEASLP